MKYFRPIIFIFILFKISQGTYIFDGHDAYLGQFPYMVAIHWLTPARLHNCGGSIIDTRWVLSAAHCFPKSTENYEIEVGSVELYTGTFYSIRQIIKHEKYKVEPHYDIALLEVNNDFDFRNPYIRAIKLYNNDNARKGDSVTAIGWGNFDKSNQPPAILQYTDELYLAPCRTYSFVGYDKRLICASHVPAITICKGDSGGPAVYQDKLIGVIESSGTICTNGAQNSFTKVYFHKDWILKNIDYKNVFDD